MNRGQLLASPSNQGNTISVLSRILTLAAVIALLSVPVAAGAGIQLPSTSTETKTDVSTGEGTAGPIAFQQETPTANASSNTTIQHVNPEQAGDSGNLTNVRRWLEGRIEIALISCARSTRINGNGTCEMLGEEYPSLVERYEGVAEATSDSNYDNMSRVLYRTGENQQLFARAVWNYRDALASYRNADGVSERRSTGRNISRYGSRAETRGGQLIRDYETVAENSTIQVTPAREITADVIENITETTDEIRSTEFVSPEMTVSLNTNSVSFTNPAVVRGHLRSENGTALTNQTLELRTPEQAFRTETNEQGEYNFTYRPKMAPTGETTIILQYVPQNDSQYLETTATINVSIRSTEGLLELNQTSYSVVFDDDVPVRGSFSVNGTGVEGIPVTVVLGEAQIAELNTTEYGRFTVTESLSADISAGTSVLNVSMSDQKLALTAKPALANVQVNETTPVLFGRTERLDAETVRVSGSITVDQTPVSVGTVEIRRAGETLESAPVSEEGAFETNATISALPADESATITLAYNLPGGNLEPVEIQIPINPVPSGFDPNVENPDPFPGILEPLQNVNPVLLAVGLLTFLIAFVVVSSRRFIGSLSKFELLRELPHIPSVLLGLEDEQTDQTDHVEQPPSESATEDKKQVYVAGISSLETANERLYESHTDTDESVDESIIDAYKAARQQLDARFGIDPTLTHWELLAVYGDSLDEESREALEHLTTIYERAAFSPAQSTVEAARKALDSAGVIVGEDVRTDPNPSDD